MCLPKARVLQARGVARKAMGLQMRAIQKVKLLKNRTALFCVILLGSAQANPTIGSDTLLGWLKSRDERDGALAVGYIGGVRELTFGKEHCASNEVKVP